MWGIQRGLRVVRYTLPIESVSNLTRFRLKITDPDQELKSVHAHKVSAGKYLVVELRTKDIFVCVMQNETQQYVVRKMRAQPWLWMLKSVHQQQLVMMTEQAALVEVFQDKAVWLVDASPQTQRRVLGMQSENTIVCCEGDQLVMYQINPYS